VQKIVLESVQDEEQGRAEKRVSKGGVFD